LYKSRIIIRKLIMNQKKCGRRGHSLNSGTIPLSFPGGTDENHEKPQPGKLVSGPISGPGTF
jgi:hypothetical protein